MGEVGFGALEPVGVITLPAGQVGQNPVLGVGLDPLIEQLQPRFEILGFHDQDQRSHPVSVDVVRVEFRDHVAENVLDVPEAILTFVFRVVLDGPEVHQIGKQRCLAQARDLQVLPVGQQQERLGPVFVADHSFEMDPRPGRRDDTENDHGRDDRLGRHQVNSLREKAQQANATITAP
ncbi:MAG: hypothetical protein IH848_10875 [Acidobacteria bacterium]|nr:hypothetical protein [Acidobacteriota bacterium]